MLRLNLKRLPSVLRLIKCFFFYFLIYFDLFYFFILLPWFTGIQRQRLEVTKDVLTFVHPHQCNLSSLYFFLSITESELKYVMNNKEPKIFWFLRFSVWPVCSWWLLFYSCLNVEIRNSRSRSPSASNNNKPLSEYYSKKWTRKFSPTRGDYLKVEDEVIYRMQRVKQ